MTDFTYLYKDKALTAEQRECVKEDVENTDYIVFGTPAHYAKTPAYQDLSETPKVLTVAPYEGQREAFIKIYLEEAKRKGYRLLILSPNGHSERFRNLADEFFLGLPAIAEKVDSISHDLNSGVVPFNAPTVVFLDDTAFIDETACWDDYEYPYQISEDIKKARRGFSSIGSDGPQRGYFTHAISRTRSYDEGYFHSTSRIFLLPKAGEAEARLPLWWDQHEAKKAIRNANVSESPAVGYAITMISREANTTRAGIGVVRFPID